MSVRCGRCACYHEDSKAVMNCYNGGKSAVVDVPGAKSADRPTQKQIDFANKLLASLGRKTRTEAEWLARGQTKRSISELINDLTIDVDMARKDGLLRATGDATSRQIQAADWPTITSGYYAVRTTASQNNDLDFFKVDVPEDDAWKGCIFVKRILGGGDGYFNQRTERVPRKTAEAWLGRVANGGECAAKALYGQSIGRCGVCNRELTDEISRAKGIGPTCASVWDL